MQEIAINRLWTEKEYKEGGKVVGDLADRLVFAKIVQCHGVRKITFTFPPFSTQWIGGKYGYS